MAGFFATPVPVLDPPTSTVLLDRDGKLLGATTAADQQWRFPPIDEVPPRYAAAVLRYEDKRFYWHPGVDPLSVGRAIVQNVRAGRVESGASTLTMQVVRMSRGNPARTLPEKALEALLALRLDAAMDKDAILAAYANNAPFGGNTVGIEAASWRYYGHGPTDLSWGEAAALAVLPNSPSLVRPVRNAEPAL